MVMSKPVWHEYETWIGVRIASQRNIGFMKSGSNDCNPMG